MLVSNLSTLILIAKISALSKFLDRAKKIVTTEVVYDEILKKDSFENSIIKKEVKNGRIIIDHIQTSQYSGITGQFRLDGGEASTFALYMTKRHEGILTDDKELIKVCRIEQIKFVSSMAIILMLFKRNIIGKSEALEKLEMLQGYGRFSNEIYEYFKNKVK